MAKGTELRAVITASDKLSPALRAIARQAVATKAAMNHGWGTIGKEMMPIRNRLTDLGASLSSVARGLGIFGLVAGGAAAMGGAALARSVLDAAGAVQDASEVTGVAVENLQKWHAVAGMAGVSTEDVNNSMVKLNKSLFGAANGEKKSAALFKQMGIEVRNADGSIRRIDDVLPQVAEAFDKTHDPATRTAMAMTLFGKSGAKLIPILAKGKGLAEALSEAQRKGIVVSESSIAAMDDLGDNMGMLGTQVRGIAGNIMGELAPSLTPLVQGFSEWLATNKDLIKSNVTGFVKDLADKLKNVDWAAVADAAKAFFGAVVWFVSSGALTKLAIGMAAIKAIQIGGSFVTAGKDMVSLGVAVGGLAKKGAGWVKLKKNFVGPMPAKQTSRLAQGLAKTSGWMSKLGKAGKVIRPLGLALSALAVANTAFASSGNSDPKEQQKAWSGLGGALAGGMVGAKLGAIAGTMIGGPVGTAVGGVMGGIIGSILGEDGATALVEWCQNAGTTMGGFLSGFFTETLPYYVGYGVGWLVDSFSAGWAWATSAASAAIDGIIGFVASLPGRAIAVASTLWTYLVNFWNDPLGSVSGFISSASGLIGGFIDTVKGWFSGLGAAISSMFSNASAGYNAAVSQTSPLSGGGNGGYQGNVNVNFSNAPKGTTATGSSNRGMRTNPNVGHR